MADPCGRNFGAVNQVLNRYLDGLYHADSTELRTVFHPDARYVNAVDHDYMNYSVTEYFNIVDARVAPVFDNEMRADQIISIEFGGPHMAFAKVAMSMLSRNYLDFLTLLFQEGRWMIVSKVFTYNAKPEEK